VRVNQGGELFTLNYGYKGALAMDPVEKKPLYHFLPGTLTFSLGAPGCNFDCLGCQNHSLAHPGKSFPGVKDSVDPSALVDLALESGAKSMSFTYSEPTVFFEYAQDTGTLAEKKGLYNIWVTNGYFTPSTLEDLDYVRAMNIDLKGFTEDFYSKVTAGRLEPVKKAIEASFRKGIWVELTTLLIPTVNDKDEDLDKLSAFIAALSPDIPWHISRFMPLHKQSHLYKTPRELLLRAREIGKKNGLNYVYIGNLEGPGYTDTACPECGTLLVGRAGYLVTTMRLGKDGKCPHCGTKIAGVWG
jgi:pyruvate formate lyase activating enzyme